MFIARAAIEEMHRQVGALSLDENGVARYGLIVRHLILPNNIGGSQNSLRWIADTLSTSVTVSIMAQYAPLHHASKYKLLNRKIVKCEYDVVLALLEELGIDRGWLQDLESSEHYIPDFDSKVRPFILNA